MVQYGRGNGQGLKCRNLSGTEERRCAFMNNMSYLINDAPCIPYKTELSRLLSKERMETVLCFDCIPSSNLTLSELSKKGAKDSTVVIANEQTSGRGRRGRSFLSPKNKGIYLSYLMRRDEAPEDVTEITAWTAVATARAIEKACGVSPSIKWVNDLFMNNKKICGILAEMSLIGGSSRIQSIIIGIGINVNEEESDFGEDLKDTATSISIELGKKISRAELAAELIKELDRLNTDFPKDKLLYLKDYRRMSLITGKQVLVYGHAEAGAGHASSDRAEKQVTTEDRIKTKEEHQTGFLGSARPATALCVNDDFSLKVRYSDTLEEEDLKSGEVSIRPLRT